MTEDIKPEVLKKTQTALNKYIKKPPLTDKLLKKPPFRFLHDIITNVIKETGYLNGVFSPEELIADNVKDKDSKIKFLTKLIAAVKDSTGNNIKAKPGKIVAGLEVDKTLELLQAVAKGIGYQKNGNKSISNNRNEKNKPSKDSEATNDKSKVVNEKKESQKSDDVIKDRKKKKDDAKVIPENAQEKKRREKSEKKDKPEKEDKLKLKEVKRAESFLSDEVDTSKPVEISKKDNKIVNGNSPLESTQAEKTVIESSNEGNMEVDKISREASLDPKAGGTGVVNTSREPSVDLKTEDLDAVKKEDDIVFRHKEIDKKVEQSLNGTESIEKVELNIATKIETDEIKKDVNSEIQPRRPSTRRSSSRARKSSSKKADSIDKGDIGSEKVGAKLAESSASVENAADIKKSKSLNKDTNTAEGKIIPPPSAAERPRTARRAPPVIRPPSARPPSVRPGAPKTRDRGEVPVEPNSEREEEAKEVVVITENQKAGEDKEDMVVLESQALNLLEGDLLEDVSSQHNEGLLIDVLKSESGLDKISPKSQTEIEWEGDHKDKRETWKKECEELRAGIQALTRSTGPLGKLFDFLQEDVDLAARELSYWKQASANYGTQLQTEQRLTEESLSKHRKKLIELAGQIEEEQMAIRAVKASILANDRKILTLISRSSLSE